MGCHKSGWRCKNYVPLNLQTMDVDRTVKVRPEKEMHQREIMCCDLRGTRRKKQLMSDKDTHKSLKGQIPWWFEVENSGPPTHI